MKKRITICFIMEIIVGILYIFAYNHLHAVWSGSDELRDKWQVISNILLVCDECIASALAAWLCIKVKPMWKASLIFLGYWAAVNLTEGLLQWSMHLFGFKPIAIWQNFAYRIPALLIFILIIDGFAHFRLYVRRRQAEKTQA